MKLTVPTNQMWGEEMNISKVNITVELNEQEIWSIIFPMIRELKGSAEHYINHFNGKDEEDFIAYVLKENAPLVKLFESFSKVIDRSDLMNEVRYHCKQVLKAKLEKGSERK